MPQKANIQDNLLNYLPPELEEQVKLANSLTKDAIVALQGIDAFCEGVNNAGLLYTAEDMIHMFHLGAKCYRDDYAVLEGVI